MRSGNIITLSPSRWKEYRELRLQSLHSDPTSFARTYQEDASLADTVWQNRLKAAELTQTAQENSATQYGLFVENEGKLVGMAWAIIDQGSCVQHRATIVAVYSEPSSRGKGIAK